MDRATAGRLIVNTGLETLVEYPWLVRHKTGMIKIVDQQIIQPARVVNLSDIASLAHFVLTYSSQLNKYSNFNHPKSQKSY